LGREEQCKRDLEDLQTRLGREMAERQMTQKQLQDELERARAEMAWQDRHKQQTEQERNELATRVRLLEDRVKEESTEKQKLEGTASLPCVCCRVSCAVRWCACAVVRVCGVCGGGVVCVVPNGRWSTGVQYSLKRELSARRQSRALLQEEARQHPNHVNHFTRV